MPVHKYCNELKDTLGGIKVRLSNFVKAMDGLIDDSIAEDDLYPRDFIRPIKERIQDLTTHLELAIDSTPDGRSFKSRSTDMMPFIKTSIRKIKVIDSDTISIGDVILHKISSLGELVVSKYKVLGFKLDTNEIVVSFPSATNGQMINGIMEDFAYKKIKEDNLSADIK